MCFTKCKLQKYNYDWLVFFEGGYVGEAFLLLQLVFSNFDLQLAYILLFVLINE